VSVTKLLANYFTIQAMDNTEPSRDELHLGDHKKVHWALNLEEIIYFAPDTEVNNTQSMLKKFKMKARALRRNHIAGLLDACDCDLLRKMQEIFERFVRSGGHCNDPNTEDLNDLNKYWDELFDFYGECKPGFENC